MEKKQIIICFENGHWLTDCLHLEEGQDIQEALDRYQQCYEAVREHNLPILHRLLPAIIHVSIMGEQ